MKTIASVILALFAVMFFAGCSTPEEEPNVPIATPSDDGPQPASVSAAGSAPSPAAGGASQAPETE